MKHTCATCAAEDPRYAPEEYAERPGTDLGPKATYICPRGHANDYAAATAQPPAA